MRFSDIFFYLLLFNIDNQSHRRCGHHHGVVSRSLSKSKVSCVILLLFFSFFSFCYNSRRIAVCCAHDRNVTGENQTGKMKNALGYSSAGRTIPFRVAAGRRTRLIARKTQQITRHGTENGGKSFILLFY